MNALDPLKTREAKAAEPKTEPKLNLDFPYVPTSFDPEFFDVTTDPPIVVDTSPFA
jgi:hypothetical protein